uniref:C2H2-type domain-containing protein n=1 Tax=Gouania willdenowi TaxID=441366 RepID=A0A8C5EF07_GOUWI
MSTNTHADMTCALCSSNHSKSMGNIDQTYRHRVRLRLPFPTQASFRLHMELSHGQTPRRPTGPQQPGWGSGLDLTLLQEQGLRPGGLRKPHVAPAKCHVCDQCGRSYRHASSLLNHKNSHKTGAYFCSSCQKEFPNLMSLKNHRRIHTEPKRYQCPDCGKSFRVSTQLVCHRRIHTKEKPFSCAQCHKRFSSLSNLRHHMKVHWGGSATPPAVGGGSHGFLAMPGGAFI